MRTLTSTLLAAQQKASHTPYLKVEVKNKIAGVVRLDWVRLYTGTEDDYFHAMAMPGDSSLIRARITLPADGRKLYRQRVANPGPASDFSSWSYTSQYNCLTVAAASLGAEVSIFWINSAREIQRIKSTDNGVNWGTPELIDYSPTTAVNGLAVAYKPNGDLAIFFADGATLYVKKRLGGSWQTKSAWDKTTGDLSGIATVYDADWNLLVTGKDSGGNFKLWSLIYGDGGDVTAGAWSALKELASVPADGNFEYTKPFLAKPDVYRVYYIEKFAGTQSYNRPFWSHSIPDTKFIESLWRESVPVNLSSQYGLAIAYGGNYGWLSNPNGVWRASLTTQCLDLTADVLSLRLETGKSEGRLAIELRNDDGRYASLPAPLDLGSQVEVSPGYITTSGAEVSPGMAFSLVSCEYAGTNGKASLFLGAGDGWADITAWTARHQFRWNKASNEKSTRQIIEFVLARVGLKLGVKSESSAITGNYPDFAINPGDKGEAILRRLLSFVPDVIFVEGNKAYVVNPQAADSSVYAYGQSHATFGGKYRAGAWAANRVQVEGYDPVAGERILQENFAWSQVDKLYDRLSQLEDRNIDTTAKAQQRGDAYLREAEIEAGSGTLSIPVNCGQQLYDVIDITDSRAGLSAAKKRVLGLTLIYEAGKGQYQHQLTLGGV